MKITRQEYFKQPVDEMPYDLSNQHNDSVHNKYLVCNVLEFMEKLKKIEGKYKVIISQENKDVMIEQVGGISNHYRC